MKVLNLRCANDHRFEGWFGSEADFQSQCERGLIECPLCGDTTASRLPSAPHVHVSSSSPSSSSRAVAAQPEPDAALQVTRQTAWMQAVRHVIANTDDVGDGFAEEARRMHYGEADERAIRGRTTREDARALLDEGIEVMPLALPPALKGPVQ